MLKNCDKHHTTFQQILDFGCGCGRVLRFFRPQPHQTLIGCDIDNESIQWCQQYLTKLATFHTNAFDPPLPYAAASFDFIYSISVFTHLPESLQWAWLAEIHRLLKPEGIFITSIHGEQLVPAAYQAQILPELQQRGFFYLTGTGTPGLPDFYQNTFHTHTYIREQWQRYFSIRSIQVRAINNHQDGIVAQKC